MSAKQPWYRGLSPSDLLEVVTTLPHLLVDLIERFEALSRLVFRLLEIIEELQAKLHEANETIARLRHKLGLNSSNSSRPPSSDPPWDKPKRDRAGSSRSPGAQPGHPPHERELLDSQHVDEVIELRPEVCRQCRCELTHERPGCCKEVRPTQTIDWLGPKQGIYVREYRRHRCCCSNCGCDMGVELPADDQLLVGAGLEALISILSIEFHLSRRQVQKALKRLFGVDVGLGTIQKVCVRVSNAVGGGHEQIREYLREQKHVGADETGWRHNGKLRWLWVVCSEVAVFFEVAPSRGAKVIKKILGEAFSGIVGCDGLSSYAWIDRRQRCWAHLVRNFQELVDYGGQAAKFAEKLLEATRELFELWWAFKDGDITRRELLDASQPVKTRFRELFEGASDHENVKIAAKAKLLQEWDELWRFLEEPGVEPTNNGTERTIRAAVILRKKCYQTRSEQGARFVTHMLSVVGTLDRLGEDVLLWITRAVREHRLGQSCPSIPFGRAQKVATARRV